MRLLVGFASRSRNKGLKQRIGDRSRDLLDEAESEYQVTLPGQGLIPYCEAACRCFSVYVMGSPEIERISDCLMLLAYGGWV